MILPAILGLMTLARAGEVPLDYCQNRGVVCVDLHLDTPTQLYRKHVGFDGPGLEAGLAQLRAGRTNLAVEVLWPPQKADWEPYTTSLFDLLDKEAYRSGEFEMVRSPEAAVRAGMAGHIGYAVSLEGAHGIDKTGIEGLRRLHDRGLSLLGLTWSFSNRFAGSSGDKGGGLTTDGWQLVVEANRLGVVLDVSHASDQTTMDVCGWSHAPVIASHSDTDALRLQARNLSDEAIRCIARTGGVIGLNLHREFVGGTKDIAALADHADHLRDIGGIGVVALGSDFDGLIQPIDGIKDASGIPMLWDELRRRGWSDEDLRKAEGENFMRAWQRTLDVGKALRGERVDLPPTECCRI